MNIFWLDDNLTKCAEYHCDKHIVKMILEYAQLLSTAHHVVDGPTAPANIYKITHKNHPCAVWARTSESNYVRLADLLRACLTEYTVRYGKVHKVEYSGLYNTLRSAPVNLGAATIVVQVPLCMPDYCKINNDVVASYRNYYRLEKASIAKWKIQEPSWWLEQ